MSDAVEVLGTWHEFADVVPEHQPRNRMVLNTQQLAQYWRRVSLTADFWSNYLALHLPAAGSEALGAHMLPREAVHGLLSYLLNELFENCAKFSSGGVQRLCFEFWRRDEQMIFQITNHIKPEALPAFVAFLHTLLEGDPAELYFQRIEEYSESNSSGSGLGFLTLMMDYGVRFGFRFRPVDEESVAVDVQAHVSMLKEQ